MAYQFENFDKRLRRIDRAHRRATNGYTPVVGPDGLIAIRPRRKAPQLPIKGLLLLALGFFAFKGIMLAHFGLDGYVERVEALRSGTVIEQAGAWVMQVDPAAAWIAAHIGSFIH